MSRVRGEQNPSVLDRAVREHGECMKNIVTMKFAH